MKRSGLRSMALLFVPALAFITLAATAGDKHYAVGDKIADFAFKSDTGKMVRLSQFRGKTVVLNFFATW